MSALFERETQAASRSLFNEHLSRLRRYPNLPPPKRNGWHQMMAIAWRAYHAGEAWMSEDYDPEDGGR